MRSLLPLSLVGACSAATPGLNIPILCKYHQESHAAAGAIVGLGMQYWMRDEPIHPVGKFIIATATALGVGMAKEGLWDKHARGKEIAPWAAGAAAVSLAWQVRF